MTVNLSSLTCYAILSAVEQDLRDLIAQAADSLDAETVLGTDLTKRATERRAKENRQSSATHLTSLLPFIDFADALSTLRRIDSRLLPESASALKDLSDEFSRLVPIRNRVAHSRPLEIDDLPRVADFAPRIAEVPGFDWVNTLTTLTQIREAPGFVLGLTPDLIIDDDSSLMHNLPPADFDETGFLGRKAQRQELVRALKGPWPVVSILGDGGLGKTALALQVAYDLLDDADQPFEAIVWTTAKNATLTTTEILKIEGAIKDSLGLFSGAVGVLAGAVRSEDAIDEVLQYLDNFKVLLVLDNLETVIDDNIRGFLRRLPHGSKVLITSRIGVGTENPFKLEPLSLREACRLLRTLARTRHIGVLSGMSDASAESFVSRMNCHPGFIKWFVSGVQSGLSPESLIENNQLLLNYCMTNVYEYLNSDARAVLRSMIVLPGAHTLAELAHLNELSATQIQGAVLDLTTTNFLSQVRGGTSGTAYALSDFAKSYLQKSFPVAGDERIWLLDRHQELYRSGGDLLEAHSRDPYAPDSIDIRSAGDFHAAKCLRTALELAYHDRIDEALSQCQEAAELAPGYHEAFRIQGYIHELASGFSEAFDSYDRARDLARENPYVAYSLGNFLCATGFNPRQGLAELQRAARLDEGSTAVKLAIANAHLKLGNFADAINVATSIANSSGKSDPSIPAALAICIESTRLTSSVHTKFGDWAALAEGIEHLVSSLESASRPNLSQRDLDILLLLQAECVSSALRMIEPYLQAKLDSFSKKLEAFRLASSAGQQFRQVGIVKGVRFDKGYAFASSGGEEYFLHATNVLPTPSFESLEKNMRIVFTPGPTFSGKKPRTLAVTIFD